MSRFREDDNDDRNAKGNFAEINIDVGSIFIGVTLNKGGTVIMREQSHNGELQIVMEENITCNE